MRYFRALITTACLSLVFACASTEEVATSEAEPPDWFLAARDGARASNIPTPLLSDVPDKPADLASRAEYAARAAALLKDGEAGAAIATAEPRLPVDAYQEAARAEIQSILDWYVGIDGQTRTTLVDDGDESS